MEIIYSSALILGFISSFHCLGMCGPIALSLGLTGKKAINFHTQNISYQLGRIVTYSFLGAIVGMLGKSFKLFELQSYISIISGALLILMVFLSFNKLENYNSNINFIQKIMVKVKISLSKYLQKQGIFAKFITGIINGFLPCGPVYFALAGSIATAGIFSGALYMLIFGLGTIPLMFLTVLLGNKISANFRNKIFKIFPYITILIGVLFILRGMSLGIPFLSPDENALNISAPVQDCCH